MVYHCLSRPQHAVQPANLGCPILLALFWREGGHSYFTQTPTLSAKDPDKGGEPGQSDESSLSHGLTAGWAVGVSGLTVYSAFFHGLSRLSWPMISSC